MAGISPLAESWIVCFLYQRSQTFSPRLYKEQDSRLYIGPAVGFHVIPEEGVLSYVVPDLSLVRSGN